MHRLVQATLAIVLVSMALAGPASAAPAATVVGGSCDESAFDAAVNAGGDITFNCGGPKTILLTIAAGIYNDTSIDGGGIITLTGNLTTTLFDVGTGVSLSLSNITLDRGHAKNGGDGGAILNTGSLFLDHVRIQNSVADEFGGAIYTIGRAVIQDSSFDHNSAPAGGALYALNSDEIEVDNSTFTANKALDPTGGLGGAVMLVGGSQLVMTGGGLTYNSAPTAGGAVYIGQGASASFTRGDTTAAQISYNSTKGSGGGVFNDGGQLTLFGADIEYNQTVTNSAPVGYGGGIANYGLLSVDQSAIASNQGRYGGGVYVAGDISNGSAAFTHTTFLNNLAASAGGGLDADLLTTTVTIENDMFANNQAYEGGGLARTNAHLTLSKSSFTNNIAVVGGGLALLSRPNADSASYVEVQDVTFSGNQAQFTDGAIDDNARLDLRNVTLKNNENGLYVASGATARLQSTALDNGPHLNCAGDPPSSSGHNLATDSTCNLSAGSSDQIGVAAMLGPLTSDPHVFTQFHVPQPGSPLINNGGPGCAPTDQRYALRADGACDIGAIEFNGLLPKLFLPLFRR